MQRQYHLIHIVVTREPLQVSCSASALIGQMCIACRGRFGNGSHLDDMAISSQRNMRRKLEK